MTHADVTAWFDRQTVDAPAELLAVMRRALASLDARAAGKPHDFLFDAAIVCTRDALALGDDRAAATPLLAADALLTWACELAADGGGAALDSLLDRASEQLAALLDAQPAA